jgi:LacI family transcriptional regulator, galactose operon repressor
MAKTPHVALLVETSHGYGRALLQGIMQYLREHRPWSVYFQPHGLEARPPDWLMEWEGDGILVRVNDRAMARAVHQTGLPAVNLRVPFADLPLPVVGLNNHALGELAHRHLCERGLKHFAFCGIPPGRYSWMDERRESFEKAVRDSGRECHTFVRAERRKQPLGWEEEQNQIADWIRTLPKPVGMMAGNDDRGREVLEACRRAGVVVPDELAVIGVDDDEFLCNLSNPPMSSISPNAQRIGYEAAALLDRLMAGARPPRHPILLPPGHAVVRESTDVLATDDRELAAAVRYLREHACEGLRLKDFFKTCPLSRRELERRMRKLLGRSPKEEITRVKLERAKQLLTETKLSAAAVADRCGFRQAKYFSQVFHAHVGLPPGAYRLSRTGPS